MHDSCVDAQSQADAKESIGYASVTSSGLWSSHLHLTCVELPQGLSRLLHRFEVLYPPDFNARGLQSNKELLSSTLTARCNFLSYLIHCLKSLADTIE